MAKVTKPIKKIWSKIKKDKNTPIELTQKGNESGIVKMKKLNTKK